MTQLSTFFKRRWQYLAVLLTLCALAYFAVQHWLGPQVAAEAVQRRDFVQSVVASGHVESPHRVEIGAQITATVAIQGNAAVLVAQPQAKEAPAARHVNSQCDDGYYHLFHTELRRFFSLF